MADVRKWQAVEYQSIVKGLTVTRAEEFEVAVQLGKNEFTIGVSQLRPLAEAFARVADEIEDK